MIQDAAHSLAICHSVSKLGGPQIVTVFGRPHMYETRQAEDSNDNKPVFILSKHLKIEVKTEVNVLIFRFFFLAQHSTHQSGYYRLSRHTPHMIHARSFLRKSLVAA